MISDLGVKMLQHLVCLVQWIAFALVQGRFWAGERQNAPSFGWGWGCW